MIEKNSLVRSTRLKYLDRVNVVHVLWTDNGTASGKLSRYLRSAGPQVKETKKFPCSEATCKMSRDNDSIQPRERRLGSARLGSALQKPRHSRPFRKRPLTSDPLACPRDLPRTLIFRRLVNPSRFYPLPPSLPLPLPDRSPVAAALIRQSLQKSPGKALRAGTIAIIHFYYARIRPA